MRNCLWGEMGWWLRLLRLFLKGPARADNPSKRTQERMGGIMWRLDAEARRDAARARNAKAKDLQGCVKVVVVELAAWQARHFGSRAG